MDFLSRTDQNQFEKEKAARDAHRRMRQRQAMLEERKRRG